MQNQKNAIIEKLFTGKNFNDCIGKMEPAHLRDDLKMEVIAIVCEWPEDKIIKLHEAGAIDFYVARVIINQIKSDTSPFYLTYRRSIDVYSEVEPAKEDRSNQSVIEYRRVIQQISETSKSEEEIKEEYEDRQLREELEDYALEEINNLYWYDKEMILLYLKHGTFRKIQEHTNIPYISCYKNIQKSLEVLRKKALGGENKPLFTKEETNFIQS